MAVPPAARRYAEFLAASTRVRDGALFLPLRIPNELEIQARWFAGEFGRRFVSTEGNHIEVIQFGTWNREAGPDFSEAAISVNGGPPVRGSIEIDLVDRNWDLHGHARNPAFEETVLHIFVDKSEREFFSRTKSNRNVPQVRIDPAVLPEAFSANIPLAQPGRCQAPLKGLPEERIRSVLAAAARFRLEKKAARIRANLENHGRDAALFHEIAAALGYKENKLAFTLIAQRAPLRLLRENPGNAEAILFGLAGFLEAPDLAMFKKCVRNYVRDLWDRWWPHRDGMQRLILPEKLWKLTSTRPANHPQRRLAALAVIAWEWPAFRRSLGKRSPKVIENFLETLDHPFWKTRYTLAAVPSKEPMALIGQSRAAEIFANVIVPFWLTDDHDVWPDYTRLPARLTNRRIEVAATRLFWDDPRRRDFTRTIANQQALLQIYEDFCLQDNSDCARCPFPEQMKNW